MTSTDSPFSGDAASQGRIWGSGNLRPLATAHSAGHDRLIQTVNVQPGEHVLDVGAGTGSAALAAARRGAAVTAIDLVADFLAVARERAAAENVAIATQVADAQDLPYSDDEFDVVLSSFAVMFAPDQQRAAAELVRVCRPGGRIGIISWTPNGYVGQSMAALSRYQAKPGGTRALNWGDEDYIRALFAEHTADLRLATHAVEMRHESPDAGVDMLRAALGPVRATFDALDPVRQQALAQELKAVMAQFNRTTDGTVSVQADYLEVLAVKAPGPDTADQQREY